MTQSSEFKHISVLLDECIDALAIKPDGIYIDATFGRGGHSAHILNALGDEYHLFVNCKINCKDRNLVSRLYLRTKPYFIF